MVDIVANPEWKSVRILERDEVALGGYGGNMNEQATALVARTELLMQEKADTSDIVQGQHSFTTLAAFDAVKSTIPANSVVIIDEVGGNQGTNTWDGTTLTKSAYDPLAQAKEYTNQNTQEKIEEIKPYLVEPIKEQKGIVFAIAFNDGLASWLSVDESGLPPEFVKSILTDAVKTPVSSFTQSELGVESLNISSGIALAFPFADGTLTDLTIGLDGQFKQFVVDRLAARMGVQNLGSLSRIDLINCLGDSLTEGGTTDGSKYTTFLQNTMPNGTAVNNFGISGQESMDIAIRCGAVSYKVDTFTISTNSPVSITAKQLTRKKDGIAINGRTRGSCTGYFSGIHGTLNMAWDAPTFTPDFAPESLVIIPDNTEFSPDHANQIDKEGVLIWWSGQNDLAFGWPYVNTAPRDCAKAMIDILEADKKRVVIIGVTTTANAWLAYVTSQNNLLREYVSGLKTAGHDAVFLDAQAMLTDVNILKDLDVDLNDAAVQASLAEGLIPKPLTTDNTHFNADVKENFTAKQLKRIFAKKGWL